MAQSLDIDELVANLGNYCRENRDVLVSEALLDQNFEEKFEIMDDVTDEVALPSLEIADLIKPSKPDEFRPTTNAVKFGGRILKTRPISIDLLLIPQIMEKTFLGKQKSSSDPFDIPFEAFIMAQISKKAKENLHLKALYKGVYNADGETPETTMTGWLKLIADEITALNITPVVTGVITATNVIDSVEAVYDGLGEAYKAMNTQMPVNPTIFDWYGRRYRSLYNGSPIYTGIQKDRVRVDGTMCELVREPGLGTSQRLICSPKENFVMGVDTLSDYHMDIQKFNRSIKVLMDLKAGVQLKEIHGRALSVNDQV